MYKYKSIDEIKKAHEAQGGHFFDPGWMRIYRSRIGRKVYRGQYFITSEQFISMNEVEPRRYTVKKCVNGEITTVGEFQQFATRREAIKFIETLK